MKRIRRFVVYFFSLVMLLSMTPSSSNAATLTGYVRYVYGSVGAGGSFGIIYIYRSTGAFCGIATVTGVGAASSSTVAYETFRDVVLGVPPFTAGHYVGAYTSAAAGFCNGTIGPLLAYYVRY